MRGSDQFFRVSTVLLGKAASVTIGMVVKRFALGSNSTFTGLGPAGPDDRSSTNNFYRSSHFSLRWVGLESRVQLKEISAMSKETRSGSKTLSPLASRP